MTRFDGPVNPPRHPPAMPSDAGQVMRAPALRVEIVFVDRVTPALKRTERSVRLTAKRRRGWRKIG